MSLDFTKYIRTANQKPVARFTVKHSISIDAMCQVACHIAQATVLNVWDADEQPSEDILGWLPKTKGQLEEEIRSTYAAFGSEGGGDGIPMKRAWEIMSDRIEKWYGYRPETWDFDSGY
jgi:hypothetical protein